METPTPEQLQTHINQLAQAMNDPLVMRDPKKIKALSHELGQKEELLKQLKILVKIEAAIQEASDIIATDSDEELKSIALDDLTRRQEEKQQAMKQLEEFLYEKDPMDERDIILEIRSGAGGDEAGLFAAQLMRAYARFAETQGWHTHIVTSSTNEQGGYKEVIAELSGQNVFGAMKFESGVHRVQRIPDTEKQGRIHTSTITVAILPQAEEIDFAIKPEDLRIDTYRASGAGGQHVNKTSSAVRITHLPTNTVVAVQDERSQHKNRAKAMKVLRSRLLEAQLEKSRRQTAQARKEQVGTGDRSEKIRTYNFPQDRITDHRIKQSWSNIASVMEGNLETMLEDIKQEMSNVGNKS